MRPSYSIERSRSTLPLFDLHLGHRRKAEEVEGHLRKAEHEAGVGAEVRVRHTVEMAETIE